MTTSSDAAEQLVRIYLEGAEVALRISGSAAKNVAAALYAISQDKNKTKGKIRLGNMIKMGKELKIFSVKREDLKKFSQEAKRYGVLYCALVDKDKNNPDGMIDVMVRAEDASKINRIVERFNLNTLDKAEVKREIEKSKENNSQDPIDIGIEEKSKEDKLVEELLTKPISKEENQINPSISKTDTEKSNQLENFSKSNEKSEGIVKKDEKPSIRKELKKIKKELEMKEIENTKEEKNVSQHRKPKHMKEPKHMKKKEKQRKE